MKSPLLLLLLAFLLVGCGHDKISQKNFDRIKEGMSRAEVEAILGKPTEEKSAGNMGGNIPMHVWDNGRLRIVIIYTDKEKVFIKKSG